MSNAFTNSSRREWRYLRNNPFDFALVTWIPLLLIGCIFYLLSSAVLRQLPIVVVDQDQTASSRAMIRQLQASPGVSINKMVNRVDEAWPLLRRMEVYAAVYIPEDTERALMRGEQAAVFAYYNAALASAGQSAFREIQSALQAMNVALVSESMAKIQGVEGLRAAPISAQATVLFNPARNFDIFLSGLLLTAMLHLMLCVQVTSALCRELRDDTVEQWLQAANQHLGMAICGKILPYFGVFSLYMLLGIYWVAYIRGDGIQGSAWVLVLAAILLLCAYSAIGLLIAALAQNMSQALSLVGLYAGTSLAFCAATFPIEGASRFARIWHSVLPYSSFVKIDAQQRYMPQADFYASLPHLLALIVFTLLAAIGGYVFYRKALLNPSRRGMR